MFPVFWGTHAPSNFELKILLPAWLIGGMTSAVAYIWNFVPSPDSPGIMPAIQNPLSVVAFFFTAMGAPFAYGTSIDPVSQAFFIGFTLVVVFTFLIVKFFLDLSSGKETKIVAGQVLPWLFIGIWPIVNIAISAVGRCSFVTEMALSSRYATNSVLLTISFLFICSILTTHKNESIKIKAAKGQKIADEKNDESRLFYEKILMWIIPSLATLYIGTIFWIFPHFGMMRSLKTNAKAALMFTKFIVYRDLLGPIWRHNSMDPLYPRVEFLEKMGFLTPKRVDSLKISSFATALPDFAQSQIGEFDGAAKISENQFQLSGWAVSNDGSRPADSVLLTRELPGQEPEVFALARVGFPRQEIAEKLNRQSVLRSGWAKQVSIDETASRNLVLKAWALDTTTGKITPIPGSVNLSGN